MRRLLSIACICLASVLVHPSLVGVADAQSEPVSTTSLPPAPDIIPRPNQGVEPTDPGDRGGFLQGAIFFVIVGGTATIGLIAYRQSRRARAERGF